MKLLKIILLSGLSLCLITACETSERDKAAGEKLEGSAKQTLGKLTDSDKLEHEGKMTRTKGDLRDTKEDVKDLVTGN